MRLNLNGTVPFLCYNYPKLEIQSPSWIVLEVIRRIQMKVAVASDDGKTIAAHTGRCRSFIIYEVSDGKAVRVEAMDNRFTPHMQGSGHGEGQEEGMGHPRHLHDGKGPHGMGTGGGGHGELLGALEGVEVLIARGMGPRLVNELTANGIRPVFSAEENADAAVQQFAEGKLDELGGSGLCEH